MWGHPQPPQCACHDRFTALCNACWALYQFDTDIVWSPILRGITILHIPWKEALTEVTMAISHSWHLVLCTTGTVGNALVSDILGLPAPNFFCNIVFVLPGIRGPTLLQMVYDAKHICFCHNWRESSHFLLQYYNEITHAEGIEAPKTGSCRHRKRGDVLDQSYTFLSWTLLW